LKSYYIKPVPEKARAFIFITKARIKARIDMPKLEVQSPTKPEARIF